MSDKYDNWERLVKAVLLREQLRELALMDSRETSDFSDDSSSCDFSVGSNFSFSDHRASSTVNIINHRDKSQLLPTDYSDLWMSHSDWKSLLPPGENEVVWRSASLSFSLDRRTGKDCFMVGARGLEILETEYIPYSSSIDGARRFKVPETQNEFISYSQSRFSEAAEIKCNSGRTHIRCVIEAQRLSPDTIYGAHLAFKLETLPSPNDDDHFFLHDLHKELHSLNLLFESTYAIISFYESADVADMRGRHQRTSATSELYVVDRGNGWKEVEIGNFYVGGKNCAQVLAELAMITLHEPRIKGRFIVEGFEFRPKYLRPRLSAGFRLKTRKGKRRQKERKIIVLNVEVNSDDEKKKAMKVVSTLEGVEYVYMSKKDKELTVVGDDVDTVQILRKLSKTWHTVLLKSTAPVGYTRVFKRANPVLKVSTLEPGKLAF